MEWRKRLDDLARAIVMIRDGAVRMPNEEGTRWTWHGRCRWCVHRTGAVAQPVQLYWAHIEPKGQFRALRWEPENAFALCYYCHMHRWHKDIRAAQEFRVAMLGAAASDALAMRARISGRAGTDYGMKKLALLSTLHAMGVYAIDGVDMN